jgi:magnesium transporter
MTVAAHTFNPERRRFEPADSAEVLNPEQPTWSWLDILLDEAGEAEAARRLLAPLDLDRLALDDAIGPDLDLPKVDDYDDHLLIVLRELSADRIVTHEVSCFLTARLLVTIRHEASPVIDAIHSHIASARRFDLAGPDELAGSIGEATVRRYLLIERVVDDNIEALTEMALDAHPLLLEELTALRSEVAQVRGLVRPHRDAFDQLRQPMPGVTDEGRRRFADAYDTASRAVHELDGVRSALAEVLAAYQGAEARRATEITQVLTVYAAVLLPLALVAAVFGMNVPLPGDGSDRALGWIVLAMAIIAVGSMAVFVRLGWLRFHRLNRGLTGVTSVLVDALRAPATVIGAATPARRRRRSSRPATPGENPPID